MSVNQDIQFAIQRLAGTYDLTHKIDVYVAEVSSEIDIATRTVEVKTISFDTEISIPSVKVMASIDNGIIPAPTLGSMVLVGYNLMVDPFIILCSSIDYWLVYIGNISYKISADGIALNGDGYGGLMQIAPSITAWNNLQNDVNNLKTLFNTLSTTIVPTSTVGSPDAFQALFITTMASYISNSIPVTSQSDIENTKVKHGG